MSQDLFSRNHKAGHLPEAMGTLDVLCIGAGALAQNFLLTLGLEGPKRVRIVDRDTWSDHNATRSPLYGSPSMRARCQNLKAPTVAHELRRMTAWNPALQIEYACHWIQELGDAPFREPSVVVSCVDDPAARAHIAEMCHRHGKPMVEGGLSGSAGSFAVYADPNGACWQCGVPIPTGVRVPAGCRANAEEQARQGFQAMTQPIASILGAYMAEAVIQLGHGERSLSGKRVYLDDIRRPEIKTLDEPRSAKCPCPHEPLSPEAFRVAATPESPAGKLLAEVAPEFDEPRLWLRSPFVAHEICPGPLDDDAKHCGAVVDVGLPEWQLRRHPRCPDCGGEFPISDSDRLAICHDLTADDTDLLDLPLSRFGFAAGDWLTIEDRDSNLHVVVLSGGADRFTTADGDIPSTGG